MHPNVPPDLSELLAAFALSILSGAISISQRVAKGHASTFLWIVSEFMTAILCGYLMFSAYPALAPHLPDYITLPIAVALAAHSGGRIFQEIEDVAVKKLDKLLNSLR